MEYSSIEPSQITAGMYIYACTYVFDLSVVLKVQTAFLYNSHKSINSFKSILLFEVYIYHHTLGFICKVLIVATFARHHWA